MTAGIIPAIHHRWAAAGPLCDLLPAARVSTGLSADAAVPRAVVTKESDQPLASCNDGSAVGAVGVRIQVFHSDYDAAAAVVERVKTVFDRAAFPLDDGATVINVRRTNDSQQQQDDGTWRMIVDFTCMVHQAARR